jgi:hypothetical protein
VSCCPFVNAIVRAVARMPLAFGFGCFCRLISVFTFFCFALGFSMLELRLDALHCPSAIFLFFTVVLAV